MAEDTPNNNRIDGLKTHTGHPLTTKEARFIDEYVVSSNGKQAVEKAGYKGKPSTFSQVAYRLLNKDYIAEEINYRLEQAKNQSIADATEVMEYFTKVMRGEETDQFGLDAPLAERTKCAQELAKRLIDIPQKAQGAEGAPKLTITVDWGEDASANVTLDEGESIDTTSLEDKFDTKKRDNLE